RASAWRSRRARAASSWRSRCGSARSISPRRSSATPVARSTRSRSLGSVDAARTAEVHQRLAVVPTRDEQLGDLRLHPRAELAGGKIFELSSQAVQFLNFRGQAVPF